MSFNDLRTFVERKMLMNHVYQPLLIRALVDFGGSGSIRQIAQRFVAEDEGQLLYYERRIGDPRIQWTPWFRHLCAASNCSGLTPPRWLCRRERL